MLALGTPAEIRAQADRSDGSVPTMEDAFIDIVAKARTARKENAA